MLPLLLASTTFLFSCNQADEVIRNVWQNDYLTRENQLGIIESMLEATPPNCSAHDYHDE